MGRAAAAGGRRHGSRKAEKVAKLPSMAAVKKALPASPAAGYLEVLITRPDPLMRGCKAWPASCFLEAYVGDGKGDTQVGLKMLPVARGNMAQEKKEMERWGLHLRIPVRMDWPSLSLDLRVRRVDHVGPQLVRDGPHTTRHDAVIGVARVKLLDALVLGDDDEDEEGEDRKKRRREEMEGYRPRMEGTLKFNKTVTLHDWAVTAPLEEPDSEPRPVWRGTVKVCMAMFHD